MSEYQTPGSIASKANLKKKLPVVSTTPPANPSLGDVWIDDNPAPLAVPTTVSPTAPSNPAVGDIWVDTTPSPKTTVSFLPPTSPAINDIWIDLNS